MRHRSASPHLPRVRLFAPFVIASLSAFALVPLPPRPTDWRPIVAAALLTIVILVAGFMVPWRNLPSWTHPTVPLAYLVVVGLLRHSEGGAVSGYTPLCVPSRGSRSWARDATSPSG